MNKFTNNRYIIELINDNMAQKIIRNHVPKKENVWNRALPKTNNVSVNPVFTK